MDPVYFRTPDELRAWLAAHGATATELLVGFHRKHVGVPGLTYQQALDEALCVGWIDGVRRRVDDARWSIRFTPRTARSSWSQVNLRRAAELIAEGRMQPAGLAAYEARERRPAGYSYEERPESLDAESERTFRAHRDAWAFFEAQPPGYRRTCTWWVVSARRPETRARRLATLVDHSARGERLPQLAPPTRRRDATGE